MIPVLLLAASHQENFPVVPYPMVRPPAIPLVAHDPYFSIWANGSELTDKETTHWTGKPQPLHCLIQVDGKSYRILDAEPKGVEALYAKEKCYYPTRTIHEFSAGQVSITMTFLTPALPSKLEWLARPATYLIWDVKSLDKKSHDVKVYFDCSGLVAVDNKDQKVKWEKADIPGQRSVRVGSVDQDVLVKRGDDLRIDWGYGYISTPDAKQATVTFGDGKQLRTQFVKSGVLDSESTINMSAEEGVLACSIDLGSVGSKEQRCHAILAYDDEYGILYFGRKLKPYWRQPGMTFAKMIQKAEKELPEIEKACKKFDDELLGMLKESGGMFYEAVCSIAYRQTHAANKIVTDANGKPLVFPKENFSNGCIATVDVLFPQAPFYLLMSPELFKGSLQPILDYSLSSAWPYAYAPHDLGTYPHSTGQVYGMGGSDGDRMPVEESGNMLIMLAALARVEGNANYSKPYMPLLEKWTDYLVKEGLDPFNQLCSADMFGHLPHSVNLSLKAIIGIASFANLCDALQMQEKAAKYRAIAEDYAKKWLERSNDGDHPRLAFDKPGTWGMMHNLIWDRLVGKELFPRSLSEQMIKLYSKQMKRYGLPVDCRTDTSLIDWATWSISVAKDKEEFEGLFQPIHEYVQRTPTRVPLCDWYSTTDAKQVGFQARSVVGGIYIMPLTDLALWQKWAARGQTIKGEWAPFPLAVKFVDVMATAQKAPTVWKYTLNEPGADWMESGSKEDGWLEGEAGFGTVGTPGAIVRTEWNTKNIWLRREFSLTEAQIAKLLMIAHYDENADVYVNGKLLKTLKGWTSGYEFFELTDEARKAFKVGKNIVAVHCRQTTGGQYIDLGFVVEP